MAIKAVDRDEGRNGYVEYSLEENGFPFTLGTVDGLLRVSGPLDREHKPNYTLQVSARDRGDPPKSSSTKVTVVVLDENDNSPIFDPRQYSATVAENASIGASVLQVRFLIYLIDDLFHNFLFPLITIIQDNYRLAGERCGWR